MVTPFLVRSVGTWGIMYHDKKLNVKKAKSRFYNWAGYDVDIRKPQPLHSRQTKHGPINWERAYYVTLQELENFKSNRVLVLT